MGLIKIRIKIKAAREEGRREVEEVGLNMAQ